MTASPQDIVPVHRGRRGWPMAAHVLIVLVLTATSTWSAAVFIDPQAGFVVVALGALALVLVTIRASRRLWQLAESMGQASRQVTPEPLPLSGPAEVRRLNAEFNVLVANRGAYETRLSHQALHDALTGLPNRALFMDRLAHAIDRAGTENNRVGVVAIDLDGFRLINDSHGHQIGDGVIRAVASRIGEVARPGDTVARFGGDEYVVLLDGIADVNEARGFVASITEKLVPPLMLGSRPLAVTACIGVAICGHGESGDEVVRDAHAALRRAKEHGTNRSEVFDAALRTRAASRMELETDLRLALERRELHLLYQPKFDLVTGAMVGAEALVRWQHPTRGLISPAQFVAVAEESGLIIPMGRFVLTEACKQAAVWNRMRMPLLVSVNLSARQLRDDDVPLRVSEGIHTAGVKAQLICLELTESMLLHDPEAAIGILEQLHQVGVRLSVDDFGTGYSSLSYLQRFPVDELKIDRSFVHGLDNGGEGSTLLSAIVAMAQALSLHVVAEGVETAEQAAELMTLGCHTAQGYFFARPQTAGEITDLMRRRGTIPVAAPDA